MYGITETTVHVTYRPITADDLDAGAGSVIGVPHPRPADLRPRPRRASRCRSACRARCTSAAPAWPRLPEPPRAHRRSASCPIPSPPSPSARLYRTGDLARRLAERRPRVPRPHRPAGQDPRLPHRAGRDRGRASPQHPRGAPSGGHRARGRRRATSASSPTSSSAAAQPELVDELRERLRAPLPDYMVPAHFVFAPGPAAHAKRQARSQGAAGARSSRRADSAKPFIAPRTANRTGHRRCVAGGAAASTASASTTTSSSSAAIRSSASRSSRGAASRACSLTPKDLFKRRRSRAARAGRARRAASREAPAEPVERRRPAHADPAAGSSSSDFAEPHHWNQAFLFEVADATSIVDVLERALGTRVAPSRRAAPALRQDSRMARGRSSTPPTDAQPASCGASTCRRVAADRASRRDIETHAARPRREFDLATGPAAVGVHFALGSQTPGRVAARDPSSGRGWRVLARAAARISNPPISRSRPASRTRLPDKTSSMQAGRSACMNYARGCDRGDSIRALARLRPGSVRPLPHLTRALRQHRRLGASAGRSPTRPRRRPAHCCNRLPAAFRTQINDVLLCAPRPGASALDRRRRIQDRPRRPWARRSRATSLDVSRTVGWFTTLVPGGARDRPGRRAASRHCVASRISSAKCPIAA